MLSTKTSRAWSAAILTLLVSVLAAAWPAEAQAQVTPPVTKYSSGMATIGDGVLSSGTFNVTDYGGNPAKTLQAAVKFSDTVRFLKGSYVFSEPFVSGRSGMRLQADGSALFTCSDADAVSFFDLSGSDVTLEGFQFSWSTWVDDQIAVRVSAPAKRTRIRDCRFSVTPSVDFITAADKATPMKFVFFNGVVAKWVENSFFFPQAGVTVLRSDNGNGLKFFGNEVSNGTDGGFPELSVFADMAIGLDLRGDEWCQITGNKFWAIGNYTLYGTFAVLEPDACIRYDGSTTGNEEFGHLVITDNIIENVNTPAPILLISCQWFEITGNLIGPNFAAVSSEGEGAIKIMGSNFTATTLTTIVTGTKTFTFSGTNPNLATGETFYVATTGLANPQNARTYTASAPSSGSGPWTVVTVETPAAAETAITGTAYIATSGSVGPKKSWAGLIASNDIHNSAGQGSAGVALWIEHAEKISVLGNNFNLQRGLRICRFDTPTTMDLTVAGNAFSFFENSTLNPTSVIAMPNGIANRVGFTGNTFVGDPTFVSGTITGNFWFPNGIQEITADGGGDTTLAPEAADTAEQLTTNTNLNGA